MSSPQVELLFKVRAVGIDQTTADILRLPEAARRAAAEIARISIAPLKVGVDATSVTQAARSAAAVKIPPIRVSADASGVRAVGVEVEKLNQAPTAGIKRVETALAGVGAVAKEDARALRDVGEAAREMERRALASTSNTQGAFRLLARDLGTSLGGARGRALLDITQIVGGTRKAAEEQRAAIEKQTRELLQRADRVREQVAARFSGFQKDLQFKFGPAIDTNFLKQLSAVEDRTKRIALVSERFSLSGRPVQEAEKLARSLEAASLQLSRMERGAQGSLNVVADQLKAANQAATAVFASTSKAASGMTLLGGAAGAAAVVGLAQLITGLTILPAVIAAATAGLTTLVAIGLLPLLKAGVDVNSTMETVRLGIASLLTALSDFQTAEGVAITDDVKALDAALLIADDQLRKLRIDAIETAATFEQLSEGFQAAVAPGIVAGLNLDQIRQFTVRMGQAMGALRIPFAQIAQETRAILEGNINQNAAVARRLGITRAAIEQAKEQNRLAEFLDEKFKSFAASGVRAAQTFAGLTSNLQDAFNFLTERATERSFETLKERASRILAGIFDFDQKKISDSFEPLLEKIDLFLVGAINRAGDAVEFLIGAFQRVGAVIGENREGVNDFLALIDKVTRQTFGLVGQVAGIAGGTKAWGGALYLVNSALRATSYILTATSLVVGGIKLHITSAFSFLQSLKPILQNALLAVTAIGAVMAQMNPTLALAARLAAQPAPAVVRAAGEAAGEAAGGALATFTPKRTPEGESDETERRIRQAELLVSELKRKEGEITANAALERQKRGRQLKEDTEREIAVIRERAAAEIAVLDLETAATRKKLGAERDEGERRKLEAEAQKTEQQALDIRSDTDKEVAKKRADQQVAELDFLKKQNDDILTLAKQQAAARIQIVEDEVELGRKARLDGADEVLAIRRGVIEAEKKLIEKELEANRKLFPEDVRAGNLQSERAREIRRRLEANALDLTRLEQEAKTERVKIAREESQQIQDVLLTKQQGLVAAIEIRERAVTDAFRAAGELRVRTAEQTENAIIEVERKAQKRRLDLAKEARANAADIPDPVKRAQGQAKAQAEVERITAEGAAFEAEALRRVDAARREDLRRLEEYAEERRRIAQDISAQQLDIGRLEIERLERTNARRLVIARAVRDDELNEAKLRRSQQRDDIANQLTTALERIKGVDFEAKKKQALRELEAERATIGEEAFQAEKKRIEDFYNAQSVAGTSLYLTKKRELEELFRQKELLSKEEFERRRAEIEARHRATEEREDPLSSRSLFGDSYADNLVRIREEAEETGESISNLAANFQAAAAAAGDFFREQSEAVGNFGTIAAGAFAGVTNALGSLAEQYILTGQTGPAAMRKILAATLATIAKEALVKSIYELAAGFAALFLNPAEAAAHFKSAALYGAAAAAAGAAGRAAAGNLFTQDGGAGRSFNSTGRGGEDRETQSREFRYGNEAVEPSSSAAREGSAAANPFERAARIIVNELDQRQARRDAIVVRAINENTQALTPFRTATPDEVVMKGAPNATRAIGDAVLQHSRENSDFNREWTENQGYN